MPAGFVKHQKKKKKKKIRFSALFSWNLNIFWPSSGPAVVSQAWQLAEGCGPPCCPACSAAKRGHGILCEDLEHHKFSTSVEEWDVRHWHLGPAIFRVPDDRNQRLRGRLNVPKGAVHPSSTKAPSTVSNRNQLQGIHRHRIQPPHSTGGPIRLPPKHSKSWASSPVGSRPLTHGRPLSLPAARQPTQR